MTLCLALSAGAQVKPALKSGDKWEVYYDRVPVSGEIRVGAQAFDTEDKVIPGSFFVKIPKDSKGILCVEISSRDGRYEANLPYDIGKLKAGVHEFLLPTQHIKETR